MTKIAYLPSKYKTITPFVLVEYRSIQPYLSPHLLGLTSIIIENIFLITTLPNITSSSKGEVFVLGSLISVSTHSSLLALSSTWLSSPHQCHHHTDVNTTPLSSPHDFNHHTVVITTPIPSLHNCYHHTIVITTH